MSDNKASIALIGLGGVADAHLSAYAELEDVNIAAVCDVREDVAVGVAKTWNARAYTDYRALLAGESVDLVLVLTPASTHREIVEACAAACVSVLCEKPLAATVEDAEAVLAACRKAGVTLFYGSCYRYLPAVAKAKSLIDQGKVGDILLMSEQVVGGQGLAAYRELPPIHYPPGGPGGPGMGIVDHGVHLVDVFSWFTGTEIVDVQGTGQVSGEPAAAEAMTLRFEGGAVSQLMYCSATYSTVLPNEGMFSAGRGWLADGSFAESGGWESEPGSISVYGTRGALRIFHYTNALFLNDGNGPRAIALEGRPAFGHFATQLQDCLAALRDGRDPSVSGEDGLRALRAVHRLYETAIQ